MTASRPIHWVKASRVVRPMLPGLLGLGALVAIAAALTLNDNAEANVASALAVFLALATLRVLGYRNRDDAETP
ncbi:MAG: hypothetical protein ACO3CI_08105 [Schleiferiaceae bacterium]